MNGDQHDIGVPRCVAWFCHMRVGSGVVGKLLQFFGDCEDITFMPNAEFASR
jgi:hypothetical protein